MTRPKPEKPRSRDKERTRSELLDALARLLSRSGFTAVGVNAVAREAGVDKVLVYRYFGGLDGLMRAFAKSGKLWPTTEELMADDVADGPAASLAALGRRTLVRLGRRLRRRPMAQEILRWELIERNELTDALVDVREKQGEELLALFDNEQAGFDVTASATILAAGVTYLVLRAKTAESYNGIPIGTDEGWKRIEDALGNIVDTLFAQSAQDPKATAMD